jgi:hypothetical protein
MRMYSVAVKTLQQRAACFSEKNFRRYEPRTSSSARRHAPRRGI